MLIFFSIGIAQVLFSILLIGKKQELIFADRILMILLLILGIEFTYSLLNFTTLPQLPDLIVFPFLVGPLLYLYTYLLSSEHNKLPPKFFLHLLPFIVFFLVTIVLLRYQNWGSAVHEGEYTPGAVLIANFLAFAIQSIIYWRLIKLRVDMHKRNMENQLSIATDQMSLKWIKLLSLFVFWGFVVFFFIDAIFFLLGNAFFESSLFLHAGMLIAVYSISFFGFRQEAIFEGQQFERFASTGNSYQQKDNSEDDDLSRFKSYLQEDKPYLIRNLTLQDLATSLKIPTYRLSELINKQLNKNFFTLINELRVEESKQRILSTEYDNLTLTAIGFDSGFNSKSSFHELFKKFTGQTPSQYRKENRN